jgi:TRAP-type C4-dicarboxylate transport system permease small subunit
LHQKQNRPVPLLGLLARAENVVLAALVATLLGLVLLQVATRWTGDPLPFTEELSRYAVILLTFLGGASCVRTRDHIAFEAIDHFVRKHPRIRTTLRVLGSTVTITFLAVVAITSMQWVATVKDIGLTGVTVAVPIYLVGLALPVSAVLAIGYELHHLCGNRLTTFLRRKRGDLR